MKPYQLVCALSAVTLLSSCSSGEDTVIENASADDSSVQADGNGAATMPQLTIENYQARVSYALTFFANEQLPGPAMPVIAPVNLPSSSQTIIDTETSTTTSHRTCLNGGEVTSVQDAFSDYSYTLNNCQVDDTVINGQVSNSFSKYLRQNEYLNFVAEINGGAAIREISGTITDRTGPPPCGGRQRSRSVEYYKITQGEQIFEIKNWQTDFEQYIPFENLCVRDSLAVIGNFSVRSPETDNKWLTVTTPTRVEASDTAPLTGVISIVAEDNSSITLDANSSSDDTVVVQIVNNEGSVVFEQPISMWEPSLLPN